MINSATFSMKTFMDHVKTGNWHFTLDKSTLKPLVQVLGGAYVKTNGQDLRTLNRAALENVQAIIWPLGDGIATSPWGLKKQKYRLALGYLAKTLFALDETDALLVGSYKMKWEARSLTRSMKFVSASTAKEAAISASGGLSKRFASEVCIPDGGMIGDWDDGHKFVFGTVMRLDKNGLLEGGGAIENQGFGDNVYCFERDALTKYMCMFDVENTPKYKGEVAFIDDVDKSYIKAFKDGVPAPAPLWNATNWT